MYVGSREREGGREGVERRRGGRRGRQGGRERGGGHWGSGVLVCVPTKGHEQMGGHYLLPVHS